MNNTKLLILLESIEPVTSYDMTELILTYRYSSLESVELDKIQLILCVVTADRFKLELETRSVKLSNLPT